MSDVDFRFPTHGGTANICMACGADVVGDQDAMFIHRDWHRRLDAIEARQRAQGTHDPDCAAVQTERIINPPCDCWLSREPS